MPARFEAIQEPDESVIAAVARRSPRNPFLTPAYAAARRALGATPWLVGRRSDTEAWETACPAFLTVGRLSSRLEVPSSPMQREDDPFWSGLREFCRRQRVTDLQLDSFGAEATRIPRWAAERRPRREYVIDLVHEPATLPVSSNHLRNVKRARRAGVVVARACDAEACETHARLMASSLERRKERGEQAETHDDRAVVRALLEAGAARLFQATLQGEVLSSVLVLLAARGGYYHSAGTSPRGMACGASHFLIWEILQVLRAEGLDRFNLGGADTTQGGLVRFKEGFGAVTVELEAATVLFAGPLLRAARLLHGACRVSWGRLRQQLRRRREGRTGRSPLRLQPGDDRP